MSPASRAPASRETRAPRAPPTKWSDEEVDKLVAGLLEAKDNGLSSENGFKATVWGTISSSLADPLKVTKVCESKWQRLKNDFKAVKFLRELSGFGWDQTRSLVTAEPEVWAELANVHTIQCTFPP
jgi:Myb/SANT-like DNA-binding protein